MDGYCNTTIVHSYLITGALAARTMNNACYTTKHEIDEYDYIHTLWPAFLLYRLEIAFSTTRLIDQWIRGTCCQIVLWEEKAATGVIYLIIIIIISPWKLDRARITITLADRNVL